jgi:hypothetical protein
MSNDVGSSKGFTSKKTSSPLAFLIAMAMLEFGACVRNFPLHVSMYETLPMKYPTTEAISTFGVAPNLEIKSRKLNL